MGERNSKINRQKQSDWNLSNRQGFLETPGPFIGIVKNNIDPTRAGRVQVFIPALGGIDPDVQAGWLTVSYASPFRGKTQGAVKSLTEYIQKGEYNSASGGEENSFQSYGMWCVPPDVGVRVLCLFVNSDPAQGYWFACINDAHDSFMTPGIGAEEGYIWLPGTVANHDLLKEYIEVNGAVPSRLPVSEATLENQSIGNDINNGPLDSIDDAKRYPHVYQTLALANQGLVYDYGRGNHTSSSVRESPSTVFGISTPGRYWMAATKELSSQFNSDSTENAAAKLRKNFRIGGHQFIMDDGDATGDNHLIKIRTAKGNMILLDDTNEQIYVINAKGTAWVELSADGRIDMYAEKGYNIRSKGNINFHSDNDILMHAAGKIQFKAEGAINFESKSDMTLNSLASFTAYSKGTLGIGTQSSLNLQSQSQASFSSGGNLVLKGSKILLNTEAGTPVQAPAVLQDNTHPATKQVGGKAWWPQDTFKSITTLSPDHEPWKNHEKNLIQPKA